tara:strand:+ start:113 stop:286 length:174 start_codon:yes stop_codon:yes gene_type:complete
MLENFDPKEKKVILIFIALLILGLVYVGTHDIQFGEQKINSDQPIPIEELSNSGRYL